MEIGDLDKDGRLSLKEYKSRYKLHEASQKIRCFSGVCVRRQKLSFSAVKLESFLVVRQRRL